MPVYTLALTSWSTVAGVGTKPWVNPGNAQVLDAVSASATSNLSFGSQYLQGITPSSFSPNPNEALTSIVATVTRQLTTTVAGTVSDTNFHLVKSGVILTAINKANATIWPSSLQPVDYLFSASDLGALGISILDIPNIGVALACISSATATNALVDAIILTINTFFIAGGPSFAVLPPYSVGVN